MSSARIRISGASLCHWARTVRSRASACHIPCRVRREWTQVHKPRAMARGSFSHLGVPAIWVSDIDGRNPLQIAVFPGYPAGSPRWSPPGDRVVFDASPSGHANIFVVDSQGATTPMPLTSELAENIAPSWSWDENYIYFASNRTGRYEVWRVPSRGGKQTKVTTNGGVAPFESPDRRFIYYVKGLERGGIWRVPVEGGDETFVVDG